MPSTLGIVASHVVPFSPLDLSPALWLDASDTSTITSSGGAVSQWNDKSGNGRNVTQATAANQPSTGVTTLNGRNVLTWDGTNDILNSAADAPDVTAMTIYAVARHSAFGTILPVPRIIELTNAIAVGRVLIARNNAPFDRNLEFIVSSNGGTNSSITSANGAMTVNTWRQFAAIWSGGMTTSGNFALRVAAASQTSTFSAGTLTPISTLNSVYRIGNSVSTQRSWQGEIAEILVWHRALTAAEITQVESYLNIKWAL